MLRLPFVLLWNLLRLLGFLIVKGVALILDRRKRPTTYVRMLLPDDLSLRASEGGLGKLLGKQSPGELEWFERVQRLCKEPRIDGVLFEVRHFEGGLARVEALKPLIEALKAAGKRVLLFSQEGYAAAPYALAAVADEVVVAPPARVGYFRFAIAQRFFYDALERLGVRTQFVHIGPYKTAAHRFIRSGMSAAQRENIDELLTSRRAHLVEMIACRPALAEEGASDVLFERGLFTADAALSRALVDHVAYDDCISRALVEDKEGMKPPRVVELDEFSATPRYRWRPLLRRPPIVAVLDCSGVIVMGDEGGLPSRRSRVDFISFRKTIRALIKNARVKAVVVAINSPGGSALASDLLWRELRRLAEKKPVVACLRSVAASGGYYLAVACPHIIAQRASLVGSIGVVAGKVSLGGLLNRLGVKQEMVSEGRLIHHDDPFEVLSREEMSALRCDARAVYRRFVARVSDGRSLPRAQVNEIGRGHVYTGDRSKELGLVDAIGDLQDAIKEAGLRAELKREPEVKVFPESSRGMLGKLRGAVEAPALNLAALETLGERIGAKDVHEILALRALFERESVLVISDLAASA